MPVHQYDSTAGAGRPAPQQPSIGCGLPGPYGGSVYGKTRLPISDAFYDRVGTFPLKCFLNDGAS